MIKIEIDDRAVLSALNDLLRRGQDLRPAFQDIGELLVASTKRRFSEGEAPGGTPWAPNKPSTLARKHDARPLIGASHRLSTEIHYRATADSLEVGSPMEYAATQQFGASKGKFGATRHGVPIPWGNIPARPFLGLSQADERNILDTLNEYLAGAWR